METRFTVLLVEIGVALALQLGILLAILATVKKSSARMQSFAEEVQRRALPTLEAAQSLIQTTKPKIEELVADAPLPLPRSGRRWNVWTQPFPMSSIARAYTSYARTKSLPGRWTAWKKQPTSCITR